MRVVLGIDVGTSAVKVVAVDKGGNVQFEDVEKYVTGADCRAEDADCWWEATKSGLRKVFERREMSVAGISVTSQAPSFVLVSKDGSVLRTVRWIDRWGHDEASEIGNVLKGEARFRSDPYFGTGKLLFLVRNHRELIEETEWILSANGFIVYKLTGATVMDRSTASMCQGWTYDSEGHGCWDERLGGIGVPLGRLPKTVRCVDLVGVLSESFRRELGVDHEIQVFAGAIDAVGSALEGGLVGLSSRVVDMSGFSTVLIRCVERGDRISGFIHGEHAIEGVDLCMAAQATSGASLDWLCGLLGMRTEELDGVLSNRVRPARCVVLSELEGERTPEWRRKIKGAIAGIDLGIDRGELIISLMEEIALWCRRGIEEYEKSGFSVEEIVLTGGLSQSRILSMIKADVLGRDLRLLLAGHGAALGGAIISGVGLGWWNFSDAGEFGSKGARRFVVEHDPVLAERYVVKKRISDEFRRRLIEFFDRQWGTERTGEVADT